MPVYEYVCDYCPAEDSRIVPIESRDDQFCGTCSFELRRKLSAPLFRFAGVVTPGGGPDRFTADMLGVPLKELPEPLKADYKAPA